MSQRSALAALIGEELTKQKRRSRRQEPIPAKVQWGRRSLGKLGWRGCVGTTVVTTKCKETILQSERPVVKRSALFTSVTFASSRLAPVPALRRLQLSRELRTEDTHAQASDPWPSRAGGKDS